MNISKKCQYALKAIFELATRDGSEPAAAQSIAARHGISTRFLEVILNELKSGGFVESRRGNEGGYILARDPRELKVREIVEFIQGPMSVLQKVDPVTHENIRPGDLALQELWLRVDNAILQVFDRMTFAELIEIEKEKRGYMAPDYCI